MKRTTILLVMIAAAITVLGQMPEKMSYQAVIRDSDNELVSNSNLGMQISILQGSVTGASAYVERHFPATNDNGLVTLEIGSGTVISGDLTSIDWSNGPYFVKAETDLNGGANYTMSGTSQLLSVPYALYAKEAESVSNDESIRFADLHIGIDELELVLGSSSGPNVDGSSCSVGDISDYKGLVLEWRIDGRPEVFQQFIYLSEYDKKVILGDIDPPDNYPRRYTTILADGFGTMMWLGVSLKGDRLYLSTNSQAFPKVKLQRIFSIK